MQKLPFSYFFFSPGLVIWRVDSNVAVFSARHRIECQHNCCADYKWHAMWGYFTIKLRKKGSHSLFTPPLILGKVEF